MPAITLTISGRLYEVVCEDDQVDHVRRLAEQLDQRAQDLLANLGPQPEARVLLMIALTLADELGELKAAKVQTQAGLGAISDTEETLTQTVLDLASRIESIAQRLERS